MPFFKEFEKGESGELLAVIDFPDATKKTPYMGVGADGKAAVQMRQTPFPHEEHLSEVALKTRLGLSFDDLKGLETGHSGPGVDLGPILDAKIRDRTQSAPSSNHSIKSPDF